INGYTSHNLPILDTHKADGIILRGNNNFDLELLLKNVDCPLIITTTETPSWLLKKWKNISTKLEQPFHLINNEGAKTIRSL
ncbi:MAG TPA: hypothetical protein VKY45_11275, partial [Marinilabiliaceae bacterium]|nr:hypothetical protein [Marinilabiliaceae bacterium]